MTGVLTGASIHQQRGSDRNSPCRVRALCPRFRLCENLASAPLLRALPRDPNQPQRYRISLRLTRPCQVYCKLICRRQGNATDWRGSNSLARYSSWKGQGFGAKENMKDNMNESTSSYVRLHFASIPPPLCPQPKISLKPASMLDSCRLPPLPQRFAGIRAKTCLARLSCDPLWHLPHSSQTGDDPDSPPTTASGSPNP